MRRWRDNRQREERSERWDKDGREWARKCEREIRTKRRREVVPLVMCSLQRDETVHIEELHFPNTHASVSVCVCVFLCMCVWV